MSSITRKLVLSILTVVLTVVALGTTTFAWFTLTNSASVQAFNAEIVSDTGIEIALSDADTELTTLSWKNTITPQDVSDYMDDKYGEGSFRFNNVTFDGSTFRNLNGSVGADDYLTLKLHFRSPDATEISMDGFTLTSGEFTWKSTYATFTNEHGAVITNGASFTVDAADAFRMSVSGLVNQADIPILTTTVYENPEDDTNVNLPAGTTGKDLTNANGAVSFYTAVVGKPDGVTSVTVPDAITVINESTPLKVLDLTPGSTEKAGAEYYGTITIRIWFEGWDPNAYNPLLGQVISSSMHFTA